MAKKTTLEEVTSPLDDYVNELIDKRLKEWNSNLTADDAKVIVKSIVPELEVLVSKEVLKHLKILLNHSITKLKKEE